MSYVIGNKNDTAFVSQEIFDLYSDSLYLWNITKDAYRDKDSKAKATTVGRFKLIAEKHSNTEWLNIFNSSTYYYYTLNKNNTTHKNCIPSSYENLNLFYATESKYIKSFHNGRIKVYQYQSTTDIDFFKIHDTINFYIALHKTIKPTDHHAFSDGSNSYWVAYSYYYPKPKKVVYMAPLRKIWESKTGLPYEVAKQLKLPDDRIPKVLAMFGVANEDVLLKIKKPTPAPVSPSKEYEFSVQCDTCDVKIYDNHTEDNDIINFIYKNETTQVKIKNAGAHYKILMADDNLFYLSAVSEGFLETCTVDVKIDGDNHIFILKKGEKVSIKLNKL